MNEKTHLNCYDPELLGHKSAHTPIYQPKPPRLSKLAGAAAECAHAIRTP